MLTLIRNTCSAAVFAAFILAPSACDNAGSKTDGKKTDGKKTDGKKTDGKKPATKVDGKQPDGGAEANPCVLPTVKAASPQETAWRLFVAMNCPTGDAAQPPLRWETWTEQHCIDKPTGPGCAGDKAKRVLHPSLLERRGAAPSVAPAGPKLSLLCSDMITTSPTHPTLNPFVPTNLGENPKFCEEVYTNASELTYIKDNGLNTLAGQAAFLAKGKPIDVPTTGVEIKADWLPAASLAKPFTCDAPPKGVFVEEVGGECYALVGIHLSSKLYTNWLWATFEPQSEVTNPNRCDPKLYSECSDPWGSAPATSTGEDTAQTPAVSALMAAAKLDPAFANYRLTGVQTDFVDQPMTKLGNSFVEFNAAVPPGEASCITCHSYAQLHTTANPPSENPNFGAFPGDPATGTPAAVKTGWARQDFSWMLGTLRSGS